MLPRAARDHPPEGQGCVKMQSGSPVHEAADSVALRRRPEASHLEPADVERSSKIKVVAHGDDLAVVGASQSLQKAAIEAAL